MVTYRIITKTRAVSPTRFGFWAIMIALPSGSVPGIGFVRPCMALKIGK